MLEKNKENGTEIKFEVKNEKEGFWKRNRKKIVFAVGNIAAGAVLGYAFRAMTHPDAPTMEILDATATEVDDPPFEVNE